MIVTEPAPESPLKSSFGQQGPQELPQSPPSYSQNPSMSYSGAYHVERPLYRQSPARRFFEAFCIAGAIYLLMAMLTSSVVYISVDPGRHHGRINWPDDDTRGWPLPSDGKGDKQVGGGDWNQQTPPASSQYPYAAHAAFELPLSSDALYLLARGSLSHGKVWIVESDHSSDFVKVDVVVNYYSQHALDRANVIQLQRKSGENGIGIFTPAYVQHQTREDQLQFDLTVHLPVKKAPLLIKSFETNLPLFAHELGDLAKVIDFRRISLHASNMPIVAQSVYGDQAIFKTSNMPIKGTFNSSTSLEIVTSNAPIQVDVGLFSDPSKKSTHLTVKTSNSIVESTISLVAPKSKGGAFDAEVISSNAPINVDFVTSPLDSVLKLHARTSNSPAKVNLHGAYEGEFSLKSSIFTPNVERDGAVEDPSGKGRTRHFEVFNMGKIVRGEVFWGEKKTRKQDTGSVEVVTSNSPLTVRL